MPAASVWAFSGPTWALPPLMLKQGLVAGINKLVGTKRGQVLPEFAPGFRERFQLIVAFRIRDRQSLIEADRWLQARRPEALPARVGEKSVEHLVVGEQNVGWVGQQLGRIGDEVLIAHLPLGMDGSVISNPHSSRDAGHADRRVS